jgi:hypothetical protein
MQAAQGVTGKRKFALAAVLMFLLVAGFFATAQRARADTGSPDPNTAGEVAAPPSQDASTTPQTTTDQQSTTDQTAVPTATAVQPQQSNVVIIIRVNSPGDDVVTQTNIVSVVAVGSNQSSTSQNSGSTPQNSGLPSPSPAGTDPNAGLSDPPPADSQSMDGQPANGQAAPLPGAAPERSQPAAQPAPAQAPSTVQQPAGQPAQAGAAAPQQSVPQRPHALRILGSMTSSKPNLDSPESLKGSPTMSATHLRRGGARGRSDASASRTPVSASSTPVATHPATIGRTGAEATSTKAHTPSTSALAATDAGRSWLDRTRFAAPSPIAANDAGLGTNLGLTTLVALLVGLLGAGALTWFASRGRPWRRAGG